jgi:hypothetical protein
MTAQTAAILFCAVLSALAIFQAALAAGAPLGRFAWGGQHVRLPPALRIGSLVAIAIYAVFTILALERAGLVALLPQPDIARIGIWLVAGYSALGVVVNAITRSKPERYTMTPVALLLAGLSVRIALG